MVIFLLKQKFFTKTSICDQDDEFIFARAGANDPNFNLRHDPVLIHRKENAKETLFASIIESHGTYSPVTETPLNPFSKVKSIEVIYDNEDYTAIEFRGVEKSWKVLLCNTDASKTSTHRLEINKEVFTWQGPFKLKIE